MHLPIHSKGFSLLESLAALALLTFGVLAGGLMQLHALRSAREGMLHTRALMLAQDLAETMQLPHEQDAWAPFLAIDLDLAAGRGAAPAGANCRAPQADCTAAAWAGFEAADWSARVAAQLPTARALVCRDAQPWDTALQSYVWRCAGGAGAAVVIKLGWQGAGTPSATAPRVVLQLAGGVP